MWLLQVSFAIAALRSIYAVHMDSSEVGSGTHYTGKSAYYGEM